MLADRFLTINVEQCECFCTLISIIVRYFSVMKRNHAVAVILLALISISLSACASNNKSCDAYHALGGSGIWGVEFFVGKDGVYFSELSPRPHDTGMATLAETQNFSEFELHARAILGIPVPEIVLHKNGASAVVLASDNGSSFPLISGLEEAAAIADSDFIVFGKPSTRPYRRMAVGLAYGNEPVSDLVERAKQVASCIKVESRN